jgi:hypothetical protein
MKHQITSNYREQTVIITKYPENSASSHPIVGFAKGYAALVCKPLLRLGDLQYERETGRLMPNCKRAKAVI